MAKTAQFNTRIIHKHDIEANWLQATNFTPQQGEIIVYDIDTTHDYERIKVGDGKTNVNNLPFIGEQDIEQYIGNGIITIKQNNETKGTFSLNQSGNVTIELTDTETEIPSLSGGSAASNDASLVGGVTVGGHAVTVSKKTLEAGDNVSITGDSNKIIISATDTNTDTKVTSVENHYAPQEDSEAELSANATGGSAASWGTTQLVTGVSLARDAKGHVTGVEVSSTKMPANPNTTYSAGTGLELDGTTFNHANNIAAGTAKTSSVNVDFGETINIPSITYDAQGHIKSVSSIDVNLPESPDSVESAEKASSADKFTNAQTVKLQGDVTGTATSQAGWTIDTALSATGVTAKTYGSNTSTTPEHGSSIIVPQITVDTKGRITSASDKTITLPEETEYSASNGIKLDGTIFKHTNSITADEAVGSAGPVGFGETINIPSITYDAQGHITSVDKTTVTLPAAPSSVSSATEAGKLSEAKTITLGGDASGSVSFDGSENVTLTVTVKDNSHNHSAYVNQNAFSNIAVSGQTTVAADAVQDTLTLVNGDNVTITTNATNDSVTISATDTKYSAGTGLELVNTTEIQHINSVTAYSAADSTAEPSFSEKVEIPVVSYDNTGHVTNQKTLTITLPDKPMSVNNATSADTLTTGRKIALSGDATGSVTFDGSKDVTLEVSVADDSHNHDTRYYTETEVNNLLANKADKTAIPEIPVLSETLKTATETIEPNTSTKKATFTALSDLGVSGHTITDTDTTFTLDLSDFALMSEISTAMVFKGSLGTGGTITTLPTASTSTVGDTYKVITEGKYAGKEAKVGDVFTCSSDLEWVLIPSGDEPSGTVTSIATGTDLTGGPITTSGTISHADVTRTDGTSDAANPGYGETFTVIDEINTSATGHVTGVKVKTVSMPNAQTIPTLEGGRAATNDTTVVGGVTVDDHEVGVTTKTLTSGSNISITGGTNKITISANVPVATSSTVGGVKSGTDITVDTDGNVSVNNNSHTHTIANITNLQSELDAAEAYTDTAYNKVISRGEQLIVNGNGIMGDNTNFSKWTFDGAVANNSPGSFTYASGTKIIITTDEFFPVNPANKYKLSLDLKSNNGLAKMYSYLSFYDADKKEINVKTHTHNSASTTTLAQDLKAGDTLVYLTDVSGWSTTYSYGFYLRIWNYTNSFGYTYPAGTYTRNSLTLTSSSNKLTNLDTTNKTVTLNSAYTGATIPAGTSVSQGGDAATYKYIATVNTLIPTTWTTYTGTIGGVDLSGGNVGGMFPPGTAYAKLGFLWNNNTAADQVWMTNVSVADSLASKSDTGHTHTVTHTPAGENSTVKFTPAGTIKSSFTGTAAKHGHDFTVTTNHGHTFTGTETTISTSYTPAGSVSADFSGVAHNHTFTGTAHNHTFEGKAVTSGGASSTKSINHVTSVGSAASHTYTAPSLTTEVANQCLTLKWSAGAHSFSANTVPTIEAVTVALAHTHSVTAQGTIANTTATGTVGNTTATGEITNAKFTGTKATISTPYTPTGTINSATVTMAGSTEETSITPAGSVGSTFTGEEISHTHTFTGTKATLTTSADS